MSHLPTPNRLHHHHHHVAASTSSQPRTPGNAVFPRGVLLFPRTLYQLSKDPDRRIFTDKLIAYHEEKGLPLQCPTIGERPLDLYRLYLAVKTRGGYDKVSKGKLWNEIAGFTGIGDSAYAMFHYIKHLLPFEYKYDRGGIEPELLITSLQSYLRRRRWGCSSSRLLENSSRNAEVDGLSKPDFDCKVVQEYKYVLLTGEGDVIIQVEDQQFKAHQSILMARSSVFAAMFSHDMKEKTTRVVDLEDCEATSFPIFLEYLYCGSTEKLSLENVFDLFITADKYDVQDLKRKCLVFMKRNLSVYTICETLQIARLYSDTDLLNLVTEFFVRNLLLIIPTTKWETFLSENPKEGDRLYKKAAEWCEKAAETYE